MHELPAFPAWHAAYDSFSDPFRLAPGVSLRSGDRHGGALREAGAHAYSVDSRDWQALLGGICGREADVMVEGKEQALAPMGVEIV